VNGYDLPKLENGQQHGGKTTLPESASAWIAQHRRTARNHPHGPDTASGARLRRLRVIERIALILGLLRGLDLW